MNAITIYCKPWCPYCVRSKALLARKRVAFEEVDVSRDPHAEKVMRKRASGVRTVPQIFIGERHIGGCDELYVLESLGELDPILECTSQGGQP